jgi:putative ABC transport system permease protein
MFGNYLRTALRNLTKYKGYSLINIAGLALGIACSLLMLFHIKDELNWDNQFPKSDRIYRITNEYFSGSARHWAVISPLHALEIQQDIPEIELTTRLFYWYTNILSHTPSDGHPRRFEEEGGFFSDPGTIEMFDLEFIKGDPSTSLTEVNTLILTDSMARRYFGDQDPIGQIILNESRNLRLRVTGVIADFDFNTHLDFDYLISMSTLYQYMINNGQRDWLEARGWAHFFTYVLLGENIPLAQAESKMPDFTANFYSGDNVTREEILIRQRLHFQPLTHIHLRSHLEQEMGPNSDIAYVYIFSAIAVFLLVIAAVNFVNISTAQAFKRMREIGVRKVMGAKRPQLIRQLLGESFILTLIAATLAVLIFQLVLPVYNNLAGRELNFLELFHPSNLLVFLAIILALSLASGLYPALFMAGFQPVTSLRSVRDPRSSASAVRKGLVVFQFVISIFMIFSTITVYRQVSFFQNKDLGFDKESLVAVKLYGSLRNAALRTDALKTELKNHSAISQVAMVSNLPGERLSVENLRPVGVSDDEQLPSMRYLRVDEDYIETMNIRILEGRSFRGMSRKSSAFILNEAAVAALNLEDPVGRRATNLRGVNAEIVGVVKDFHFASLHHTVEPLILDYRPSWSGHLLIKVRGGRIPDVIKFLESKLGDIAPENLFLYAFVDDELTRLYAGEIRMSDVFKAFALLAIFISCLGLFGLSAYSAEIRTKEIGVRKVMGASISQVVLLLSKDFTRWVLLANLIAWPLAFFAMQDWLSNFAYRIHIQGLTFVMSALLALIVALLTVSYQAVKAASANPIDSLRYE